FVRLERALRRRAVRTCRGARREGGRHRQVIVDSVDAPEEVDVVRRTKAPLGEVGGGLRIEADVRCRRDQPPHLDRRFGGQSQLRDDLFAGDATVLLVRGDGDAHDLDEVRQVRLSLRVALQLHDGECELRAVFAGVVAALVPVPLVWPAFGATTGPSSLAVYMAAMAAKLSGTANSREVRRYTSSSVGQRADSTKLFAAMRSYSHAVPDRARSELSANCRKSTARR